jgi:hypothetical protein
MKITGEQCEELVRKLKPFDGGLQHEHELEARFCEGGACEFM